MATQQAAALLIFPYNGNAIEAAGCLGAAFMLSAFIDDTPEKQGVTPHGHRVCGREALTANPAAQVLAVPGGPASYLQRREVIDGLGVAGERFATVVHPGAHVSPSARIGRNVLLMAGVVVTSNAVIGDHVCVLPNTVIHHDVTIGDYTLVGSNVSIAGGTRVGANCYIGSGSSLIHGITIGDRALVGLASTVIRDVPADARVAGSPARDIGRRK